MAMFIGIFGAILLVIYSICMGNIAAIWNFIDMPSVYITFGGSFFVTLAMCPSIKDFFVNIKSITLTFKKTSMNEEETIRQIIGLADVARKEGLLSVEEAANNIEERFLKKGILLIVDGTDPELVRNILENEIACIDTRHKDKIGFWENLGSMGPAWGMIGTLIGLINMLQTMGDDVSAVGPNMSVALVTTFYGSMLSNWICTPVATNLKAKNDEELKMKDMMVEGILSIQAGENPRVIEEKLKAFLNTERQDGFSEREGVEVE